MNKSLSKAVFNRDNHHCRHCNSSYGLHPHHVVYVSHGGKDELDNLITLCYLCHRDVHDGFLKVIATWSDDGELAFVTFAQKEIV
jgi:5-methylcytosine-specific restriction endonuclease McrA